MQFGLGPGMQVADLGAGSGFYTLEASRLVGGAGKVFAVDIQQSLLDRLKNAAREEGLHNIEVVWGNIEQMGGSRLRDDSVDRAIVSDTLFQVDNREHFVSEVRRLLKPGGKFLLVDWSDTSSISGPDARHLLSRATARALVEQGGFLFEKEISAGAHHYGLIFRKG